MTEMSSSEEYMAKRWFVVGAHQSGASDRAISRMVGLSPPVIHSIINQFKKYGTPVKKRLGLNRKGPSEGYDESGHLVDSDDELQKERKVKKRRPSSEDVVNYVLKKAHQTTKIKPIEDIHQDIWRPPTPPYQSHTAEHVDMGSKDMKLDDSDWTSKEDRVLMTHVLTRKTNEQWLELVEKLKGKHDVGSCKQRWELLRELLLKGANKSGTCGW